MWLSEIFYSFQGEGPRAGTSAIFVRTGKCNLHCTWCDTKYTWHPNFADYSNWNLEEVIKEIKKYPCKNLVITGGEPMLQQRDIERLRKYLPDHFFEIETNGSVPNIMGEKTIDQFNISPKLSTSGNENYELRLKVPNAIYKFIVKKEDDIHEIEEKIREWNLPREKVYLQPQAQTKEELTLRTPLAKRLCEEYMLKFSPRLHIEKFGNIRGK